MPAWRSGPVAAVGIRRRQPAGAWGGDDIRRSGTFTLHRPPGPAARDADPGTAAALQHQVHAGGRQGDRRYRDAAGQLSPHVLFSPGDPVEAGSVGYTGAFHSSAETERQAGGNHDGMHYFELPGTDPQKGGLLVMNHEAMDSAHPVLRVGTYNAGTATPAAEAAGAVVGWRIGDRGRIRRQHLAGQEELDVQQALHRQLRCIASRARPPAMVGAAVVGTLNNCSSGHTPWGTYLTCEETTDNYLDPTQADEGYGWVVEIDPLQQISGHAGQAHRHGPLRPRRTPRS